MEKVRRLPLHIRMLQNELDRRKEKNASYSLRGFASYLELHPSALSRILSGKQDLSLPACQVILSKLTLSLNQQRLFISSVAEDKRNRAAATLVRALEPKYLENAEFDPRSEVLVDPTERKPLAEDHVLVVACDMNSIVDLEGRFLFVDDAQAKELGTIPCELIGETWASTSLPQKTVSQLEKQQQETIESQRQEHFEYTIEEESALRYFIRNLVPIFSSNRTLTGLYSTIRDVTWDRKIFDAALTIHSTVELAAVIRRTVTSASEVFPGSCALLLKKTGSKFEFADIAHCEGNQKLIETVKDRSEEIANLVANLNIEDKIIDDHSVLASFCPKPEADLKSVLISKLEAHGEDVGFLVLLSEERKFDSRDKLAASRFTKTAGYSIKNAQICNQASS